MRDEDKTKKQLIKELNELRRQVAILKNPEEKLVQLGKKHPDLSKAFMQNSVPISITTLNEGRFVDISEAYLETFDYKRDEVIGNTLAELGIMNKKQRLIFLNELSKRGRIENLELQIGNRSRQKRDTLLNAVVISLEGKEYLLTVVTDITEKKCAQKALLETEERFRKIVESAFDIIYTLSPEGMFTFVSPSWTRLLGHEVSEVEGHSFVPFVHPDDVSICTSYLAEIMSLGQSQKTIKYRVKHKNGKWCWHTSVGSAVKNDQGVPIYYVGIAQDITERKHAEEELKENEERYRILYQEFQGLLNGIPDTIVLLSQDLKVVWANEIAASAFGKNTADIINLHCYEFRHGRSEPCECCPVQRSFLSSKQEVEETTTPDGRIWELRTIPIFEGEKVKEVIELARDITERKLAEQALCKSEATLQSIFKATPIGLCILKGRVYQSANRAWYDGFGYSKSEIIGRTPRMLYESEKEYERVGREIYDSIQEKGLVFTQTRLRRKDGIFRDVILTAASLSDDDSLGTVVTIEDITDYKQAMKALEENQSRLADIIDFLPDATMVIDKDGKIIAWNRAIEEMTGVKAEEMLGKGKYEYGIPFYGEARPGLINLVLHPDPEIEKGYTNFRKTGDVLSGEAYSAKLASNNVHIYATASVLRDSEGEIIGAIECIRNETERKQLEERLQRAEKMESLGVMAGGVAHDLNNILGIMTGYSELMLSALNKDDKLRAYAGNIMKSSERAAAIVQDMLTLARRGVVTKKVLNLNTIINDQSKTPEYMHLTSSYAKIQMKMNLDKELLKIKGSPIHLSKTLMNLISNAAEAISGEGTVLIQTESRYLDRAVSGYDHVNIGDYVVLIVSDTGEGIVSEDIKHVFEPFYTKKVMGRSGTGLGLSVVWGTVKDHGGYIDVTSKPGVGTTFTLYFPVTREKEEKEVSITTINYMGSGEAILMVDDVLEQRELAANMLEGLNYNVVTASSGEEAVEFLKSRDVDLVVLDMIMDPGIDGLETYRRIAEMKPGQKAVIVSGFAETERVKKAQELGAGPFVKKPYILEKIGLAVRGELDK